MMSISQSSSVRLTKPRAPLFIGRPSDRGVTSIRWWVELCGLSLGCAALMSLWTHPAYKEWALEMFFDAGRIPFRRVGVSFAFWEAIAWSVLLLVGASLSRAITLPQAAVAIAFAVGVRSTMPQSLEPTSSPAFAAVMFVTPVLYAGGIALATCWRVAPASRGTQVVVTCWAMWLSAFGANAIRDLLWLKAYPLVIEHGAIVQQVNVAGSAVLAVSCALLWGTILVARLAFGRLAVRLEPSEASEESEPHGLATGSIAEPRA